MKAIQFVSLITLLCYLTACANNNHKGTISDDIVTDTTIGIKSGVPDTFAIGKIITHIFCKSDPAQSYALYIPSKGNREPLPVIYLFDPHGDGSFPLSKYKALAETYDFILIGSNNSKNGNDWPATESIWRIMFADSRNRFKINNNRMYTCGFSGGAKVAGYIALNQPEIKGVIVNGAGLPDEITVSNFHFSLTAITGEGDMNMTELVSMNEQLDKTQTRHRIIFFAGKHEWAPESTMGIAFKGLQLDAMHDKDIPFSDVFISNFITDSKKKIGECAKTNSFIKAEQECKLSISMLDGLTNEVTWFKEKDSSIKNNPAYQKQLQTQQSLLATEQNLKAIYGRQLQQGDMNYWVTTIKDLQIKAGAANAEGGMYQRLLAYLSLAFYSISNRFINSNQNNEAQYFVSLYKMADAGNSEAWYFSAILNARNNNAKATNDDLMRAVANGFTDNSRMMGQPEFQKLSGQINFPEIEQKMRSGK